MTLHMKPTQFDREADRVWSSDHARRADHDDRGARADRQRARIVETRLVATALRFTSRGFEMLTVAIEQRAIMLAAASSRGGLMIVHQRWSVAYIPIACWWRKSPVPIHGNVH